VAVVQRHSQWVSDASDFADTVDVAATPSVSVVVHTRRRPDRLERCLRSVLDCEYEDCEVIVVESLPGSLDTARMLVRQFPAERRLRYAEAPGASASLARNAGLARAEGEVIAFIDDDVIVDAGWLHASVQALISERNVGCVTGLLLPMEVKSRRQLLLQQFVDMQRGFRRRVYRAPEPATEAEVLPEAAGALGSGASLVMFTEVARDLGGFDPALGPATPTIGGESLDLLVRLLETGRAVSYEPRAIVWYDQTRRPGRLRGQVYRRAVAMGAVIGKNVIAGPHRRDLLRAAPSGLMRLRDPDAREDAGRPAGYPRDLAWSERLGTVVGAIAYLLSALLVATRHLAVTRPPAPRPLRLVRRMVVGGEPINIVWFRGSEAPSVRFSWRRVAEQEAVGPPVPLVLGAAAICVAAPLAVLVGAPAVLRFPFLLVLLGTAPGIAWLTVIRGRAEPGLIVAISLSVSVVAAQSMLWLGAWWPRPCLYLFAAGCLFPLARRLMATGVPIPDPVRVGLWRSRLRRSAEAVKPATIVHGLVIGAALAAWGVSLAGADLSRIDGVGLLGAMPPTYYLAFALLLAGFGFAVTSESPNRGLLAGYVLVLIAVIHATTAVLYSEPRYAWTYPHLGVINLIAATGHADRTVSIYTNWPAFFALNAWLGTTSGVAAITYAGWAQLANNLFNVLALRFALRGLTRDERVLWTAALFFVLGNWVGQDYLSPQGFAFPLSLMVLGLCLRCGREPARPRRGVPRLIETSLSRIGRRVLPHAPSEDEPTAPPLRPGQALAVGALCTLAVVLTHQLSPVMLILSVLLLAVVTRRVPLSVPLAMGAMEVWWIWLAWPFLHTHFSLFSLGSGGASAGGRDLGAALPGAAFGAYAPVLVMAWLAILAVAGWLRRLWHGRFDLAIACFIVAPVATVVAQSYGGEGVFRAYLFALPWLAFLAAIVCARRLSSPGAGPMSRPRLLVVTPVICACLLFAYFGEELANRETPNDVNAAAWYELHAPAGSVRIDLAPNAPDALTGRFPLTTLGDPSALLELPQFTGHRLGTADIPRLDKYIGAQGPHPVYVTLTDSQADYGYLNGLISKGSLLGLRQAMNRSGQFRLVYSNPTAWIYRYTPRSAS
jgi:GT2 family glycosyltransferase